MRNLNSCISVPFSFVREAAPNVSSTVAFFFDQSSRLADDYASIHVITNWSQLFRGAGLEAEEYLAHRIPLRPSAETPVGIIVRTLPVGYQLAPMIHPSVDPFAPVDFVDLAARLAMDYHRETWNRRADVLSEDAARVVPYEVRTPKGSSSYSGFRTRHSVFGYIRKDFWDWTFSELIYSVVLTYLCLFKDGLPAGFPSLITAGVLSRVDRRPLAYNAAGLVDLDALIPEYDSSLVCSVSEWYDALSQTTSYKRFFL